MEGHLTYRPASVSSALSESCCSLHHVENRWASNESSISSSGIFEIYDLLSFFEIWDHRRVLKGGGGLAAPTSQESMNAGGMLGPGPHVILRLHAEGSWLSVRGPRDLINTRILQTMVCALFWIGVTAVPTGSG